MPRLPLVCAFALLATYACRVADPPGWGDTATAPADEAVGTDTADTGDSAVDTAPADSGEETAEPLPETAVHTWPGTFDAPDLVFTSCGGRDDGNVVVALGPDLDGDGIAELAVGTAGHDAAWQSDAGWVQLFRGRDLAGALTVEDVHAWHEGSDADARLGQRLQWVGDRDGDGAEDLLVTGLDQPMRLLGGGGLAAGGPRGTLATIEELGGQALRWDDVDGDGTDDWLFGLPTRGLSGPGSERGGIIAVVDAAFDTDGTLEFFADVYDEDGFGRAGTSLQLLGSDHDRDGIREPITNLGDDLVVVNSGTMLDWATWVDDGIRWRFPGRGSARVLLLGDIDGGGREDIVLADGVELCLVSGETANASDSPVDCFAYAHSAVASGDDLDGDGVADPWIASGSTAVALSGADLAAGTTTILATVEAPAAIASLDYADGLLALGLVVPNRWRAEPAALLVDVADAAAPATRATIEGSGSGGEPTDPTWRDLDHDGLPELLTWADTLAVFRGADLAAAAATSTSLSMCDAPVRVYVDAAAIAWTPDLDGDGVDDLVAQTSSGQLQVLDGQGLLAGTVLPLREIASPALPSPGCDLDGDGWEEALVFEGGVGTRAWSGAALAGGEALLLGTVDGTVVGCLPDLDGDGGAELLARGWTVFSSSDLDPATTLTWRDAYLAFPVDGSPAWQAYLGPVSAGSATVLAWARVRDGATEVGGVAVADLARGADPDTLLFTSWSGGAPGYGTAWIESVFQAQAVDPAWTTLDAAGSAISVEVTDGETAYVLAETPARTEVDLSTWSLGPVADFRGSGAHAMSLSWAPLGRPELAILYAR